MSSIDISVPSDLAAALAGIEGVAYTRGRRSGTWHIVTNVLAGATVTISLLQAPQTLADVASRIQSFLRRQVVPSVGAVHLDAVGPGGEMRLTVTSATELSEITELLRATVFQGDD